jgi:hypothetical protein
MLNLHALLKNQPNIHLSGKFLVRALEAIEREIAHHQDILRDAQSTDADLAKIDYGNDLQLLKTLHTEWLELKSGKSAAPKTDETQYHLVQLSDQLSLQTADQPLEAGSEVLFSFTAESYTRAMEVRNHFMGFAPYVPFSTTIVASRTLTLFDAQQKRITDVEVFVYQPIKVQEHEWHCEYYINIEYKKKNGTPLRTESIGRHKVIGFDMVQAVQSAFLIIDSILIGYNSDHENKIYWMEYGKESNFTRL